MSGFKEHAIAGVISGAVVSVGIGVFSGNIMVASLFGLSVLIGSLVSDIDTGSIPSKWFARIGIVLAGVFMYHKMNMQAAVVGILYMAFSSDKHRGFTHGWILIISCMVLGILGAASKIPQYFVLLAPFSVGLIVHRMMDR